MTFNRYLNGHAVTRQELAALSLATPALRRAVRDAETRAVGEAGGVAPLQTTIHGGLSSKGVDGMMPPVQKHHG